MLIVVIENKGIWEQGNRGSVNALKFSLLHSEQNKGIFE